MIRWPPAFAEVVDERVDMTTYCLYCHGITFNDMRGNCIACGGPREQEHAEYKDEYIVIKSHPQVVLYEAPLDKEKWQNVQDNFNAWMRNIAEEDIKKPKSPFDYPDPMHR